MTYINVGSVVAIGVLFPVLAVFAVAGRFYSRILRHNGIGLDDWICLPALTFTVASGVILIYGASQGIVGYHTTMPNTPVEANRLASQQILLQKLTVVFQLVSTLAIGFIKLAILLCYRRIFSGIVFSMCNWSMFSIVTGWTLAFFIAMITSCGSHVAYLWNSAPTPSCIDTYVLTMLLAITDFVLDFPLLFLPLPWVWRLQMTLQRKLAVTAIFLSGLFATAAGGIRMTVIIEIYKFNPATNGNIFSLPGDIDIFGIKSVFFFWSYIEVGVAMIICCAPSLRSLLDRMSFSTLLSSFRTGTSITYGRDEHSVLSSSYGTKSSSTSTHLLRPQKKRIDRGSASPKSLRSSLSEPYAPESVVYTDASHWATVGQQV